MVKKIADSQGLLTALVIDDAEETAYSKTDWVIVTRDKALLGKPALTGKTTPIDEIPGLKLWTDDFSSLYQILK